MPRVGASHARGQGEDEQATLTDSERYGRNNGAIRCENILNFLFFNHIVAFFYDLLIFFRAHLTIFIFL